MSSGAWGLNLRCKAVVVITFWDFSCRGNFLTIKTCSYISEWHVIQLERHRAAVDQMGWTGWSALVSRWSVSQSVTWQLSQSVSNDVEGAGRCGATPHTSGLSVQPSWDKSHSQNQRPAARWWHAWVLTVIKLWTAVVATIQRSSTVYVYTSSSCVAGLSVNIGLDTWYEQTKLKTISKIAHSAIYLRVLAP